jgi:hypothetical protein
MNKEFVTYEQALALKELKFNEPCLGYYFGKDREVYVSNEYVMAPFNPDLDSKVMFRAPTYSQAFRWFREKYKLDSMIQPTYSSKYQYRMFHIEGKTKVQIYGEYMGKELKTYEEAELACLKKLIEIVKNK